MPDHFQQIIFNSDGWLQEKIFKVYLSHNIPRPLGPCSLIDQIRFSYFFQRVT